MTHLPIKPLADPSTLFEVITTDLSSKGYSICPNALPDELGQLLAEYIVAKPAGYFKKAGIGRANQHSLNDAVRSDEIAWISADNPAGKAWLDWAGSLQQFLNRRLFLGLSYCESHFAHYGQGDFYKKHKDAFIGQANRVLSVVVYLNQDWLLADGGELVIYSDDPAPVNELCRVTPAFGTLVVFLSEEFPHEVLPANRDRFSIASWFRRTNVANTGGSESSFIR